MKLVASWLALLLLTIAAAGSCSVKHPSEQFVCEVQSDCSELGEGRVCSDGLCVVPGGQDAGVDAARDAALVCPSQCTSCVLQKMECVIDCAMASNGCASEVVCPPGWACNVKCSVGNSCRNGVRCTGTTSCAVECTGNSSCRNIECGDGPCRVGCVANNSCRGVDCNDSCACDVTCSQASLCEQVACPPPCDGFDGGCTSGPPSCNVCQ